MKKCIALITLLVIAAAGSLAAAQRAAPGSFIKYRVNSGPALAKQMKSDKTVAARYARHFGVSVATVEDYFAKHITLTTLKKAKSTDVYFFGKGGKVIHRKRLFPAGTMVFVAQDGSLLLDWRCGNPLTKSLPQEIATTPPAIAPEPVTAVLGEPPIEIATLPEVVTTVVAAEPVVAVTPIAVPVASAASLPVLPNWLLPVLAGGGLMAASGGGGGDTPVPEPTSLLSLAAMTGMVCTARARRRMILRK